MDSHAMINVFYTKVYQQLTRWKNSINLTDSN